MFFAFMFLLFVMMRFSHRRRRHFAHAFFYYHHHPRHGHWHRHIEPVREPPRLSAFEQLRQRYVEDEISVEQYEDELDVLMRTPEGRKQV